MNNATIEYEPIVDDETYDVTFELSEDAEQRLFTGLSVYIANDVEKGIADGAVLDLYAQLASNRVSHPPWMESDVNRTYDLVLDSRQYSIMTNIIGESLKNVLSPDVFDEYAELIDVLRSITDQMQRDDDVTDILRNYEYQPEQEDEA